MDSQFSNYTKSNENDSPLIDQIAQQIPFQNKTTIIPQACKIILTARGKNFNNRPLIAVTRGSGCGKSKLLEELRLHFDQYPDVLCSAITYNNQMEDDPDLIPQLNYLKQSSLAFSVVLRMLSGYYALQLYDVRKKLLPFNYSRLFQHLEDQETLIIQELLHATVLHLVEKFERQFPSSQIKQFVLLIDESYKALESLKATDDPDLFNRIRSSILDGKIGNRIEGRMVMTSLIFAIFRKTPSGRGIIPLDCGIIDPNFVVEQIWKENFKSSEYVLVKDKLYLLACAVYKIPRLVEWANSSISTFLSERRSTSQESIKYDDLIKYVFNELDTVMARLYTIEATEAHLLPLLFSIPVRLNDITSDFDVAELVMRSIYTNPLKELLTNAKREGSMIPEGSLFRVLSSNSLFNGIIDAIMDIDSTKPHFRGKLLEDLVFRWIEIKSSILSKGSSRFNYQPSVGKFFGIEAKRVAKSPLRKLMASLYPIPPSTDVGVIASPKRLELKLNKEPKLFLKNLNQYCDGSEGVFIIQSAPDDCFDLMLILRAPSQLPFIIFLDMKSAQPNKAAQASFDTKQYSTLSDQLKKLPASKRDLYTSLRSKNFLYLYFTDLNFHPSFNQEIDDTCYVMNEQEAKSCLTVLFDVYKAASRLGEVE